MNAVRLDTDAQSSGSALNQVNAAGADVAQGVNVAERPQGGETRGDRTSRTSQANDVTQIDLRTAALERLTVAPTTEQEQQISGTRSASAFSRRHVESVDRSVSLRRVTTLSGDLPIDIGRLTDLGDFSVDVPHVDRLFSGLAGAFDPPAFDVPVADLSIDFPSPDAFDQRFSADACTYSRGERSCTSIDRSVEETEYSERRNADTYHVEQSSSESHVRVETTRRAGELLVEQGQADVIVLRRSTATRARYDLVIVGGGAQRGLRAGNAVNAARAIIGNGFNVLAERSTTRKAGAASRSSLSQTNSFRQVGGL